MLRQYIPDPPRQIIHRERLGEDLHAAFEMPIADHGILGIAGNEKHFQIRPRGQTRIRQLAAIDAAGQPHIGISS